MVVRAVVWRWKLLRFLLGVTRTNKIEIYIQCEYITGTVQDEWLGDKVRGKGEIVWTCTEEAWLHWMQDEKRKMTEK